MDKHIRARNSFFQRASVSAVDYPAFARRKRYNGLAPNWALGRNPASTPVMPVQVYERQIRWIGRLWGLPALFTGTHDFEITPTSHGTLFRQSEAFSGVLLWFYDVEIVRTEFTKMNRALKNRAEAP